MRGIKLMESFKEGKKSNSKDIQESIIIHKDDNIDLSDAGGSEKGLTPIENEAKELGLTLEELEAFYLANEEFGQMTDNLHQKELQTKEKLA